MSVLKTIGSTNLTPQEREPNDYYATDPQALIDFLEAFWQDGENLKYRIWECACGEGNLSEVLRKNGFSVMSTDLIDRGYEGFNGIEDVLNGDFHMWDYDVITNPPYKHALSFIEKCLDSVSMKGKVIMLLRLQFLEGQKRSSFFAINPPKYVYVHSKRIGIWKGNVKTKANAVAYAWFVWEKGFHGDTILRWI
jgi:hypothetical protein